MSWRQRLLPSWRRSCMTQSCWPKRGRQPLTSSGAALNPRFACADMNRNPHPSSKLCNSGFKCLGFFSGVGVAFWQNSNSRRSWWQPDHPWRCNTTGQWLSGALIESGYIITVTLIQVLCSPLVFGRWGGKPSPSRATPRWRLQNSSLCWTIWCLKSFHMSEYHHFQELLVKKSPAVSFFLLICFPHREFFGQGWMKNDKNEKTPYIMRTTKHFNDVGSFGQKHLSPAG